MAREISESLLTKLRTLGFTGEATIEAILIPLNERMIAQGKKYIQGKAWWVDFKNKAEQRGITFDDAFIAELERILS